MNKRVFSVSLVFLIVSLVVIPTVYATTIFSDGFESGNFSAWNSTSGSISVEANNPHHGSYNAKSVVTGSHGAGYCRKDITAAPIIYTRGYYKVTALPNATNQHLPLSEICQTSYTNSIIACIGYTVADGVVWELFDYVGGVAYHTYDTQGPSINTWYCVEILRDVANGRSKLWIDGELRLDVAEAHSGNSNIVTHGVVYAYYVTANVYCDCCVVADAYVGVEAGVTEYTFNGEIPLTFTLAKQLQTTFTRTSTIALTFTMQKLLNQSFYSQASIPLTFTFNQENAWALNKHSTIPLSFAFNFLKTATLNLHATIPITFTLTSIMDFISGILLNLYGTIPLTLATTLTKTIQFATHGIIPLNFLIYATTQITQAGLLYLYGHIPLTFTFETAISGLETEIDYAIVALGFALLAFVVAVTALATKKD
jgi:hypothetical protein